ncbi:hypothetical protein SKDZ_04G1630 [Saccharomyces kudriavzevii ZP591]|nr:hypothetical protein SKDZ_04G1630 [Saccharomyces kudriavzevii ZP591]
MTPGTPEVQSRPIWAHPGAVLSVKIYRRAAPVTDLSVLLLLSSFVTYCNLNKHPPGSGNGSVIRDSLHEICLCYCWNRFVNTLKAEEVEKIIERSAMTDVLRNLVRKISFGNPDSLQLKHKTSIQSTTSNTRLEKKKRKPDTGERKIGFQTHHSVPDFSNSADYISDIENRIISKLVEGGKKGIAVDHIEHADAVDNKIDERMDVRKQENISSKLSKDRIDRMINFDYRYIKAKQRILHKKVYKHEHAGNADADKKNSEEAVNISYPTAEVVGHGSFGVVVTTVINETNQKVAIKKVLQDKRYKNRELETMKMLNHANTIGLQYYFYERDEEDEVYLNLVLDYMPQSLYQRLRHFIHLKTKMDRLEIKFYAYQLFRALNYLHNVPQICHRDIKPQNLLVDPKTFSFKICDFGSAKCLKPDQPNVSYICSRYYRAPELMFGATDYSNQIDVWSSACVITELLLGKPLFSGESGIDQLVEVIKIMGIPTKDEISGMNPNYEDHIFPNIKPITLARVLKAEDPDVLELLSKTLKYHPRERLAPLQCLFLGYFDEIKCCGTDAYAKAQRLRIFDFDVQTELGHMPPAELPTIEANLKHPVSKASTSS